MKTLKLALTVGIFACSEVAVSQQGVQNFKSVADSLRNEGNIPAALTEYKKIFLKNPYDQRNVYNYACALSVSKQIDSCFKYLNIAVKSDTSIASLIDPDFLTIREDSRWPEFENNLISMLNRKFKNPYKDVEYAKALWRLRAFDQAYFNEIGIAGRKTGMKSSVVEALWNFKFMIHKNNQKELEELVETKGWPKINDVGSEAAMGAYLVAMHSRDGSQKKYLPFIKQRCEENELSWQRYANIYDRCLFNENKPQKFGTQTRYNELTNSEEIYPLEDASKVDEWRKELGLEPLSVYLARFNIKFP